MCLWSVHTCARHHSISVPLCTEDDSLIRSSWGFAVYNSFKKLRSSDPHRLRAEKPGASTDYLSAQQTKPEGGLKAAAGAQWPPHQDESQVEEGAWLFWRQNETNAWSFTGRHVQQTARFLAGECQPGPFTHRCLSLKTEPKQHDRGKIKSWWEGCFHVKASILDCDIAITYLSIAVLFTLFCISWVGWGRRAHLFASFYYISVIALRPLK